MMMMKKRRIKGQSSNENLVTKSLMNLSVLLRKPKFVKKRLVMPRSPWNTKGPFPSLVYGTVFEQGHWHSKCLLVGASRFIWLGKHFGIIAWFFDHSEGVSVSLFFENWESSCYRQRHQSYALLLLSQTWKASVSYMEFEEDSWCEIIWYGGNR